MTSDICTFIISRSNAKITHSHKKNTKITRHRSRHLKALENYSTICICLDTHAHMHAHSLYQQESKSNFVLNIKYSINNKCVICLFVCIISCQCETAGIVKACIANCLTCFSFVKCFGLVFGVWKWKRYLSYRNRSVFLLSVKARASVSFVLLSQTDAAPPYFQYLSQQQTHPSLTLDL